MRFEQLPLNNTSANRIQTLDAIRGIALLGILFVNIQFYTMTLFFSPAQLFALHIDKAATFIPTYFLFHLFDIAQFYTIYSFLFGLGFYLMLQKNTGLGLDGDRLYLRRLAALFGFGLIHAFILWHGDILAIYAVLGLPLIYFSKKKVSTIVKWVVGITVCSVLIDLVRVILINVPAPHPALPAIAAGTLDKDSLQLWNTYRTGSFIDLMKAQWPMVLDTWSYIYQRSMTGYEHCEIMFLVGLIAGKTAFFRRIPELRPRIKRVVLILLPFALALKGFSCLNDLDVHLLKGMMQPKYASFLYKLSEFIGVLLLAFVYIGTLTLIFSRKPSQVATWIANTGRMGLTNYLGQTIICMLVFYPYGLGLAGRVTMLQSFVVALLIYIFQIIYSNIWLRYHKQGPMEVLWRRLTYGSKRSKHQVLHSKAQSS